MRRALLLPLLFAAACLEADPSPTADGGGALDAGTTASDSGTAASDSGTGSDAGVADSGLRQDAGSPPACTSRLCDSFENFDAGAPPKSPWSVSVNAGGAVVVDRSRAHWGQQAVKVTTNASAAYLRAFFGVGSPTFPVPGNAFYGRAWIYVTAVPPMTTHWTNIQGEGPVPDAGTNVRANVRYGGQTMKHLMANYDTSNVSTDCWQHSAVEMPAGSWGCYEWHYDGPANRMELWLNGTQIPALTVSGQGQGCINNGLGGKWLFPVFDTLRLGWEHYQTSIPIEMWVDDVAIDTQRIGCQ